MSKEIFALGLAGRVLAGFASVSLFAGIANAAAITTTNFTTWKSSAYITGSPTELNFMAINSSSYNTGAGITLTPTTGSASSAFTFTGLDNGAYWLAGDIYSKTLSGSSDAGAFVNIAFGTPQNAFLLGFANSGYTYTVTLSDGQVFTTASRLFGFSISHNITSLTVASTPGVQAIINDFWYATSSLVQDAPASGTPASTPEPATMLLIASGGLMLIGARRKHAGNLEN